MGSINNLCSSYIQPVLSAALEGTGLTTKTTGNSVSNVGMSPVPLRQDHGQLSPFAQLMSTLQQLQQSDPAKYQQVTQKIAENLQSAAQAAQADGNSTAANQLSQLATDFKNASNSGELPNIQDLAQAIGGHRHHHHSHPASIDPDSDSSAGAGSGGASNSSSVNQLLSAFQGAGTQDDSLNPMAIISNSLSAAGISGSNG